jgi:uncharacterized membrane protein
VKDAVPAAVGVPAITPAPLKFKPAGSAPLVIDQLYGGVPPVADRLCKYASFTRPALRTLVVMLNGAGFTVRLRFADAITEAASVTRTVKDAVPAAVGVPVIAPAPLKFNPAGSEPLVMDQL